MWTHVFMSEVREPLMISILPCQENDECEIPTNTPSYKGLKWAEWNF